MTRTSFIVGLLTISLISGSVWANTAEQECDQKKNAAGDLENKIKDQENRIKDFDNQIESVRKQPNADQKRIAELNAQKGEKQKEINDLKGQLKELRKAEAQACGAVGKCDNHKKKLDALKGELGAVEGEVAKLNGEIKGAISQVDALEKKITGYRDTSEKLACPKLVKGVSPDATIDQCRKIFFDWVSDKKDIRQKNDEIGKLKRDVAMQGRKARGIQGKIAFLKKGIDKDCSGDAVVKECDDLAKKDVGADSAEKEIDEAKSKLKNIQKIRLTKPRIKEKPEPKNKGDHTKATPKGVNTGEKATPKGVNDGAKATPKGVNTGEKAQPKSGGATR